MTAISADVIGISEHKLDTQQYYVRQMCDKAANQCFDHHNIQWSASSMPFPETYKPGGTMVGVTGNATGRVRERGGDDMGRWAYIKLDGKRASRITIISAYQVNQYKGGKTPLISAYAQQRALQMEKGKANPDPVKEFQKDLRAFLQQCSDNDEKIILMGDFNEEIGKKQDGMTTIIRDLGLVNTLHQYHHGLEQVPTYARGTTCLDYIFAHRDIARAITACGYEPFHERVFGDHRAMFVDFQIEALFGTLLEQMDSQPYRDIQARDPQCVKAYIEEKYKYLDQHNMFQRIEKLREATTLQQETVEAIDRDLFAGSMTASKKVKKKRKPWWSSKLAYAQAKLNAMRKAMSMIRHSRNYHVQIAEHLKHQPHVIVPTTIAECSASIKTAREELREIRKNAAEHREKEQTANAEAIAKEIGSTTVKIIRAIKKAEDNKKVFRKLRSIRGQYNRGGITHLEVPIVDGENPKTCTNWKTVSKPMDVERYLMERNKNHFGQARGTPLTIPPLSLHIDFKASSVHCDLMLEGEYEDEDLDEVTALMLSHLDHELSAPTIQGELTRKDFMDAFKIWDESTSTSPSGLHLGHYHCLFRRTNISDPDELEIFQEKRERIIDAHLTMINHCLRFGYPLQRWTKIVNTMIEKEKGNAKIHKLRVIHIYEADYNLILGVFWRKLLHQACERKTINEGNFGSRPGNEARSVVFLELLFHEISKVTRRSMVLMNHDATSCYDRIIQGFAMLVSRAHGLPKNIVAVCGKNLEEAKYHIRTQLGVSEEAYQHCSVFPIFGTGQGSRNSPTCWLIVCSLLFDCHTTQANGIRFVSPDKSEEITLYMIGFVDDNQSQCNDFEAVPQPQHETLVKKIKDDSQLWADLLWSSGGALELAKCTYQYTEYSFTDNGTPVLKGGKVGQPLVLQDHLGNDQEILQLSAYAGHKTLGCYIAPSGSMVMQKCMSLKKSDDLCKVLNESALSRKEAATFYHAIFLPSLTYPLPLTTFSEIELNNIQRRFVHSILGRCGYCRTTQRAIIYGPTKFGGAGFRHLYGEQGYAQIAWFLKTWRASIAASSLLRIHIAWTQKQAGTGKSILDDVSMELPYVEATWIMSIRLFLRRIKGRIEVDNAYVVPKLREGDTHIMDHIVNSNKFSPKQQALINYCRLYNNVTTIADMALADGLFVDPAMRLGEPENATSTSVDLAFNQARPNAAAWILWNKGLKLFMEPSGRLRRPLGPWIECTTTRRQWHTSASSTTETITTPDPPPCSKNGFPTPSYLATWQRPLLHNLEILVPIDEFRQVNSECIAVSAGSRDLQYCWILTTKQGLRLAKCKGNTIGAATELRTTALGCLSLLEFLDICRTHWGLSIPLESYGCENVSLTSRLRKLIKHHTIYPNETLGNEWDIMQRIVTNFKTYNKTPQVWKLRKTKEDLPYVKLSLQQQLLLDLKAELGNIRLSRPVERTPVTLIAGNKANLHIQQHTISNNYGSTIRDAYAGPKMQQYLQIRNKWTDETMDNINWDVVNEVGKTWKHQPQFAVKLSNDLLPVRRLTHRYNKESSKTCPLCEQELEDRDHLIRCHHPSRIQWRSLCLVDLQHAMEKLDTPKAVTDLLTDGITRWFNHQAPPSKTDHDDSVHRILDNQNDIGWRQIFNGRWSKDWDIIYIEHTRNNPPPKEYKRQRQWTTTLVRLLWSAMHDLWKTRNDHVYGIDERTKLAATKSILLQDLQQAFLLRPQMRPGDDSIFPFESVEECIAEIKPPQLRNWLNVHMRAIRGSVKTWKKLKTEGYTLITSYFTRRQPTTTPHPN